MKLSRTILGLALLAAGCVSVSKEYPKISSYVLSTAREGERGETVYRENVVVRKLRISPRFGTQSFVYRTEEHVYETDFYHSFLVAPDHMVTEEIRKWLRGSGLFRHVLTPDSRADAELVLEGNIVELYGDYSDSSEPKGVIELQLFLVREPGGATEVLFERTWRREVPLAGSGRDDLVEGWNRGLAAILKGLETMLAKVEPEE